MWCRDSAHIHLCLNKPTASNWIKLVRSTRSNPLLQGLHAICTHYLRPLRYSPLCGTSFVPAVLIGTTRLVELHPGMHRAEWLESPQLLAADRVYTTEMGRNQIQTRTKQLTHCNIRRAKQRPLHSANAFQPNSQSEKYNFKRLLWQWAEQKDSDLTWNIQNIRTLENNCVCVCELSKSPSTISPWTLSPGGAATDAEVFGAGA